MPQNKYIGKTTILAQPIYPALNICHIIFEPKVSLFLVAAELEAIPLLSKRRVAIPRCANPSANNFNELFFIENPPEFVFPSISVGPNRLSAKLSVAF